MSAPENSGPDGRSWFAVETRPRHEKKVSIALQDKGVENFLPLFSEAHQWSDRRRIVEMPVFPRYVFIHIESATSARIPVLRTGGVMSFVGNRGVGAAIPDVQIDNVRNIITHGVPFTCSSFVDVGQRVRIRGGALDGVEGVLSAINGNQSLVVSVEMIRRSLAIRVEGYRIERVSRSQYHSPASDSFTNDGSRITTQVI
jgi:transcription antitermination factor NusG